MKMKKPINFKFAKTTLQYALIGILFTILFNPSSAYAAFDFVYFAINGDTTLTSMTQGDEFSWRSNCDSGATINWEIWYDVNSNSSIERTTDYLLTSENITDGDPFTEDPPILDGYSMSGTFNLSAQTGIYIFRATDLANDSSLEQVLSMATMSSPPNVISGQAMLPGISAPNALLANISIFAESETGAGGAFFALTDNMGMYSINIGDIGTGVEFYLRPSNTNGFIPPDPAAAIASGMVSGVDFTFTAATDSVWGLVTDETSTVVPFEVNVNAWANFGGRRATTLNGIYAIYFSAADSGEWNIQVDSRVSPIFLNPMDFSFDLDTLPTFEQDIILTRADTAIYVRVLENAGLPANQYRIDAYSPILVSYTEAVSGIGANNIAEVHVSSLDPDSWIVSVSTWDDRFPIPAELMVVGAAIDVSVGDTVTLELVDIGSGCCVVSGDANSSGGADISDLTFIVDFMFGGGPGPSCLEQFDVAENNGGSYDCVVDISDLTWFVDFMFGGGPAPTACHTCTK